MSGAPSKAHHVVSGDPLKRVKGLHVCSGAPLTPFRFEQTKIMSKNVLEISRNN